MRSISLKLYAAVMLLCCAYGSTARGAPITYELTFTPRFESIGGINYPEQSNDGFSGPSGPFPSPQFSKITATVIMNLDGQLELGQSGSILRLHDVSDPSIVTFSSLPIHQRLFRLTPNFQPGIDRLEIDTEGPVSSRGNGILRTVLYFPSPFNGNGTAIMPDSQRFQYIVLAGIASVDYRMDSVVATVPEPAAAGVLAFALLLRRRRGISRN